MHFDDLHTHTVYSDGDATIEYLMETAQKKGYGLGISDHLFCEQIVTEADAERYLDMLARYPVYRGFEANIGENYTLPDRLAAQLDYVIASLHAVPDLNGGRVHLNRYFGERAGEDVRWAHDIEDARSEAYLEAALPVIEHTMQTQRMDIYGHATVLPFCEILAGTSFLFDWENAVLALCKKYHVALEISGLWKEPSLAMVERARDLGLQFSLGSDCHKLYSACDLDYPVKIFTQAGLTQDMLYRPSRDLL